MAGLKYPNGVFVSTLTYHGTGCFRFFGWSKMAMPAAFPSGVWPAKSIQRAFLPCASMPFLPSLSITCQLEMSLAIRTERPA